MMRWGHSPDMDCQSVGDIVKPSRSSRPDSSLAIPLENLQFLGPLVQLHFDDISGRTRRSAFTRKHAIEWIFACGQDGGVQLPREYVEEGLSEDAQLDETSKGKDDELEESFT
ncbi:hypothetical protein Scep_030399 [Stephania cephalantha]|uniref:Uncharacterized protein n=1 Tax=Stephania cephalantha TaxID=152367 RepID=A0AAP0E2S2_9MAGN